MYAKRIGAAYIILIIEAMPVYSTPKTFNNVSKKCGMKNCLPFFIQIPIVTDSNNTGLMYINYLIQKI